MKRSWIGFLLIILAIGICITEHILTKNMSENISSSLSQILDSASSEDLETATNLNKSLEKDWSYYQKPMSIFISHDILDDINKTLSEIEIQIENEEFYDVSVNVSLAKSQIESIKENEKLSIGNVL